MGAKRNIKFKTNPTMVHCQKTTTLFKYIQELSTMPEIFNYPRPDELLNKKSELISKCCHANKFLLCNYKTKH